MSNCSVALERNRENCLLLKRGRNQIECVSLKYSNVRHTYVSASKKKNITRVNKTFYYCVHDYPFFFASICYVSSLIQSIFNSICDCGLGSNQTIFRKQCHTIIFLVFSLLLTSSLVCGYLDMH
jgi:hypothetical protein